MHERSKYEALLDVRYAMRLHFLHRRLYNRLRGGVALVSFCAGSAAIATALQGVPGALLVCGVLVALASACDLVSHWSDRAARHDVWRRSMAAILQRETELSLCDIDAALAKHEGEVDDEIESLRILAYNDNLRSNGREDYVRAEPFAAKVVRLIAA